MTPRGLNCTPVRLYIVYQSDYIVHQDVYNVHPSEVSNKNILHITLHCTQGEKKMILVKRYAPQVWRCVSKQINKTRLDGYVNELIRYTLGLWFPKRHTVETLVPNFRLENVST